MGKLTEFDWFFRPQSRVRVELEVHLEKPGAAILAGLYILALLAYPEPRKARHRDALIEASLALITKNGGHGNAVPTGDWREEFRCLPNQQLSNRLQAAERRIRKTLLSEARVLRRVQEMLCGGSGESNPESVQTAIRLQAYRENAEDGGIDPSARIKSFNHQKRVLHIAAAFRIVWEELYAQRKVSGPHPRSIREMIETMPLWGIRVIQLAERIRSSVSIGSGANPDSLHRIIPIP